MATSPHTHDLIQIVEEQLPRMVRDKVKSIEVESDAYHLRTKVVFKDDRGRVFETLLEPGFVGGGKTQIAWRIPEQFIAHLCAVL